MLMALFYDVLKVHEVIDAALESGRAGCRVALHDARPEGTNGRPQIAFAPGWDLADAAHIATDRARHAGRPGRRGPAPRYGRDRRLALRHAAWRLWPLERRRVPGDRHRTRRGRDGAVVGRVEG